MRNLLLVLIGLVLLGCGDNTPPDPASPYLGTWRYTQGDGMFFCDDGQAGGLSVVVDKTATITLEEDSTIRIVYVGACPGGFVFDVSEDGAISRGDVCRYTGDDSSGHYETELVNSTDSFLTLDDDRATLIDGVHHRYTFTYPDRVLVCDVFSTGFAVRQ